MKICLVSPVPPPYGGISHWTSLMHRYATKSTDIEFIQVDTAPRWRAIYDRSIVKRVLGASLQFARDYAVFLVALFRKPDLVHLTTSGGLALFRDLVICSTSRLFRVPLVYHIRFGRVPAIAEANTTEWRIMSKVMRTASVVATIDSATNEAVSRFLTNVASVNIPNPIDCSTLNFLMEKKKSGQRMVLFLGWILPTKGIEELVHAWSELELDGWKLLLVGPGEISYQKELLHKYNPRNMEFLGEMGHGKAMQLMAQCDLFVLPSYTEGFPNVILEAMALGKPIIATSVGAIPDMLANNCGRVIRPRNVQDIKVAFTELIQDELIMAGLGDAARQKVVQEYSIEVVFARYTQMWQSLIENRGRQKNVF